MAKLQDTIKLNQEFNFTASLKFEARVVYEYIVRGTGPVTRYIEYVRPIQPYTGRVPRFGLWGARGRTIQVGSREDAAWYRRVRRQQTTIEFTIPNVQFGTEVHPDGRDKPITFTSKRPWRS